MSSKKSIDILNNQSLTISANPSRPYIYWDINNAKESKPKDGIEYGILETLAHYYNFKYNITFCNYEWGLKLPNGSWNGIIGNLAKNKSDIGLSGITMTSEREEVVSFSIPFQFPAITFVTPFEFHYSMSSVVDVFDRDVWLFILFSYISVAFILTIINKQNTLKLNQFWSLTSILLNQGLSKQITRINSLRLLYCSWILSAFILSSGYAATLTMIMTIKTKDTIDSIEKLAKAQELGQLKVIAEEGSLYMDIIQSEKTDVYYGIGKQMFSVKTPELAIKYVKESNFAYITSTDFLSIEIEKSPPNTYYLPPISEKSTFFLDYIAIAFSKSFNRIQEFNQIIRLLIEGGFLLHWKKISVLADIRRDQRNEQQNSLNSNSETNALNIFQFQSAFYLNFMGIFIALIIIVLEIIIFYINNKLRFFDK